MTCVQHLNREQLLAEIAKRDEDNARLHRENARLEQLLRLMEQKVDGLVRRLFGSSSEKLDPAQLQLLLLELPGIAEGKAGASSLQEADPPRAAVEPRRPRRERWPQDLPVVEEVLEPAEVQADPEQYRLIGAEVSEQLDYEPARFLLRRLIRRKYVRRQRRQEPPVIAPLPETLQERCIAAPGLLAAVIVGKYVDHLPLYRQEDIFRRRHQVHLPRASLARWMGLAADWLAPVYASIRTGVMAGGYVQVDEPQRSGDRRPKAARRARRSRVKPRSVTLIPAEAKPNSATCGQPTLRAATPSTIGRPAGPRPACPMS